MFDKRVLVLLNRHSGALAASSDADELRRIQSGFEARGVAAEVRLIEGGELADACAAGLKGGFDAVVGGGGDGTLNAIANALAGCPTPFAVLPLGTHNHFAKELKVPLDLDLAVAALAGGVREGRFKNLDVGEVNGRVFLNFSGIGLHPEVVRERDVQQEAMGGKKITGRWIGRALRKVVKVLAGFVALFHKLDRLPLMGVRMTSEGRRVRRITPSVIVCNNAHQMAVFGLQGLSCMDRSQLNVYTARASGPVGVLRLIIKLLLHQIDAADAREFEAVCLADLRIELRRRSLSVSVDGEVVELPTPLHYRVRRGGLRIVLPAPT